MANEVTEAQTSPTFFNSWRPLVGFVSVAGLAINFIVFPLLGAACAVLGHPVMLPIIDIPQLLTLITTTLGMSGLRTLEKHLGVNS